MAEDDRTSSAAKSVELESDKPGPLDAQENLSETFRTPAIRDYYEPNYLNDNESASESGAGSSQDHAPKPDLQLRPNDEFAKAVDRETFDARQSEQHEKAIGENQTDELEDELYDEYRASLEEQDDLSQSRDNDQGYGL